MTPRPIDELLTALDGGEWLQINDAALVIGTSRMTVDRLVRRGLIKYRVRSGSQAQRELDPDDVRAERERREQVHRDSPEA